MTCPSDDRILDLMLERSVDPELEAHLQTCADCRSALGLVRAIPHAMRPGGPVPDRLVRRAMAAVELEARGARAGGRAAPARVLVTSLLGAVTTVAALVVTGEVVAGGLPGLLGVTAIVAVLCGALEMRNGLAQLRLS
jgi:hypothetical protein